MPPGKRHPKWRFSSVQSLSRVRLCDPMDCSLPGSSVHGIFQTRVLEWGAIACSALNSYLFPKLGLAILHYLIVFDALRLISFSFGPDFLIVLRKRGEPSDVVFCDQLAGNVDSRSCLK